MGAELKPSNLPSFNVPGVEFKFPFPLQFTRPSGELCLCIMYGLLGLHEAVVGVIRKGLSSSVFIFQ